MESARRIKARVLLQKSIADDVVDVTTYEEALRHLNGLRDRPPDAGAITELKTFLDHRMDTLITIPIKRGESAIVTARKTWINEIVEALKYVMVGKDAAIRDLQSLARKRAGARILRPQLYGARNKIIADVATEVSKRWGIKITTRYAERAWKEISEHRKTI